MMSLPVSFFTTALMFVTLSLAISERPPVAMTCPERPWAGVTMASTGRTTPEKSDRPLSAPRTARPLILPTLVPRLTSIAYSDWRSRYLSATCCSRGFAIALARVMCWAPTRSAPSSEARSPAIRTSPPSSRSLRESLPLLPLLLCASFRTSPMESLLKWGIERPESLFCSFLTACAMNLMSLLRFLSVSLMSELT